jgi:hypothetical protein
MNTIEEDIEQAKLIADLHRGKNGEDGWNSVIERLAVEVERLRAENKTLREGISLVADNLGNGAFASTDASLDLNAPLYRSNGHPAS